MTANAPEPVDDLSAAGGDIAADGADLDPHDVRRIGIARHRD